MSGKPRNEYKFFSMMLGGLSYLSMISIIILTIGGIVVIWTVAYPIAKNARNGASEVALSLEPCTDPCADGEVPVYAGDCYGCTTIMLSRSEHAAAARNTYVARAEPDETLCPPIGTNSSLLYALEKNDSCFNTVATDFSTPLADLTVYEAEAAELTNDTAALTASVAPLPAQGSAVNSTSVAIESDAATLAADIVTADGENTVNEGRAAQFELIPEPTIDQRPEGEPLLVSGGGPSYTLKELVGGNGISITPQLDEVHIEGTGAGINGSALSLTNLGTNSVVFDGAGLGLILKSLIFNDGMSGVLTATGIEVAHTQTLTSVGAATSLVPSGFDVRSIDGTGQISVAVASNAVEISDTGSLGSAVTLVDIGTGTSILTNFDEGPAFATKSLVAGTGFNITSLSDSYFIETVDIALTQQIQSPAGNGESLGTGVTGPSMTIKGLTAGEAVEFGIGVDDELDITINGGTCIRDPTPVTVTSNTSLFFSQITSNQILCYSSPKTLNLDVDVGLLFSGAPGPAAELYVDLIYPITSSLPNDIYITTGTFSDGVNLYPLLITKVNATRLNVITTTDISGYTGFVAGFSFIYNID